MAEHSLNTGNQYLAYLFTWGLIILAGFWGPSISIDSYISTSIKADLMLRAIIVIGLGYLLYPGWKFRQDWLFPLVWSFMLAMGYLIVVLFVEDRRLPMATVVNVVIAVFLLSLALHSIVISLSRFYPLNGLIPLYGLLVFVLLSTLPIWIAPWVEIIASSPVQLRFVLWSSPVSYLAGMLDYDYLRQQWFYQHLPYSRMRYDYPETQYFSIGLLILSFIASITISKKHKGAVA